MNQKDAEKYIWEQINKKYEEEAKEKTEKIIQEWQEEHIGQEIQRWEYWKKKRLREILRRIERKNMGDN